MTQKTTLSAAIDKLRHIGRACVDVHDNLERSGHFAAGCPERKFLIGSSQLLQDLADRFDAELNSQKAEQADEPAYLLTGKNGARLRESIAQLRADPAWIDMDAGARESGGEFDESGGIYFRRKFWGVFCEAMRQIVAARPSVAPETPKRLIGWRTSDYLMETSDLAKAQNWQTHYDILPIFEGDSHTKLVASAPAPVPAGWDKIEADEPNQVALEVRSRGWPKYQGVMTVRVEKTGGGPTLYIGSTPVRYWIGSAFDGEAEALAEAIRDALATPPSAPSPTVAPLLAEAIEALSALVGSHGGTTAVGRDHEKAIAARAVLKKAKNIAFTSPTVAGLTKRDAARWRTFERALRTGHLHGAAYGRRFKIIETCPMSGDEKEFNAFIEAIDAELAAPTGEGKC